MCLGAVRDRGYMWRTCSLTGLGSVLSPFLFVATCLKHVELFVGKVRSCRHRIPTLDAFASSVDSWLTVRFNFQNMHNFLYGDSCHINDDIYSVKKILMTIDIIPSEAPWSSSEGGRAAIYFGQQDCYSIGTD
jgi:hypothetical protein